MGLKPDLNHMEHSIAYKNCLFLITLVRILKNSMVLYNKEILIGIKETQSAFEY